MWQKALSQMPTNDRFDENLDIKNLTVGDKALVEKKRTEFKSMELKWKKTVAHHLKICIEKFIAVLKFPEGWLLDCVSPSNEDDFTSVNAVRRILLPKVGFSWARDVVNPYILTTI